ncbi:galactokinase [Kiritimatiella glycovorans]|uniref:Galactokinase n=1 Tax=Kiritimatiella glycovorans TaxID=1307763 RepID=A0A0G3EG74_9BACT|nr:galactokinase [Kiritimatiella glycovorans]AKJ64402.1 Galactokinase [Kiritimatiella glycovorans]
MKKKALIKDTAHRHECHFGVKPQAAAYAPGRIEVLGNHTDYNEGYVISAAVDRGICVTLSKSDRPGMEWYAVNMNRRARIDELNDRPESGETWINYAKGVLYLLRERGIEVPPVCGTVQGSIERGAGLSSSAAYEVAAGLAAADLAGGQIEPEELARLCRRAEEEFAGVRCGLLDPLTSLCGREHGMIMTDFRSLDLQSDAIPDGYVFLLFDTNVSHSLGDSDYNARREACERVVEQVAARLDHPVHALRDISVDEWDEVKSGIDETDARRAEHVIRECDRVLRAWTYLGRGDIEPFGELMYESHQSSRDLFENSCDELDAVVRECRNAGALGARLSGGGFGGSALALVREAEADRISAFVRERCEYQDGARPVARVIVPSAGAETLGVE